MIPIAQESKGGKRKLEPQGLVGAAQRRFKYGLMKVISSGRLLLLAQLKHPCCDYSTANSDATETVRDHSDHQLSQGGESGDPEERRWDDGRLFWTLTLENDLGRRGVVARSLRVELSRKGALKAYDGCDR